jgi:hypothetical protein
MHTHSNKALLGACTLLLVDGCSVLHSEYVNNQSSSGSPVLAYSLPTTVFSVQIVEQSSNPEQVGVDKAAADFGKDLANKAKPTKAKEPVLFGDPKAPPLTPPKKIAQDAAPTVQPKAKYALHYSTLTVADPAHSYLVKYTASPFSDDKFDIGVNDKGLLNDLNASPTEKSVEFVKKIGELGAEVAKDVALLGATFRSAPEAKEKIVLSVTIDPYTECKDKKTQPCTIEGELGNALAKYGYQMKFEALNISENQVGEKKRCDEGLYFRSPQPVKVNVYQKEEARTPVEAPSDKLSSNLLAKVKNAPESWVLEDSNYVSIPNFSPIYNVDVKRSVGVQRTTIGSINDGYLTKYDLTKASEAISIIEAPIELAKSISSIPASLINIKKDRETALDELVKARFKTFTDEQTLAVDRAQAPTTFQRSQVEAETTLLEKQKAYIDAQIQLNTEKLKAANTASQQ